MTRDQIRAYKRSYNRGWMAEQRDTDMGALGEADSRGEPDSWYEGFEDSAAQRRKWHSLHCRDHHNDPGGCGEA